MPSIRAVGLPLNFLFASPASFLGDMLSQVIVILGRPGLKALFWRFNGPSPEVSSYNFELIDRASKVVPWTLNVATATAGEVPKRTFLIITAHDDSSSTPPIRFVSPMT